METEVQYHDAEGNLVAEPDEAGIIEFAEEGEEGAVLFEVSYPTSAPE